MATNLETRVGKLEARRANRRSDYAPLWLMRWRETADDALLRAAAEGIESIGLLLPEDAPSIEAWETEAREHNARMESQPKGPA